MIFSNVSQAKKSKDSCTLGTNSFKGEILDFTFTFGNSIVKHPEII